MEMEMESIAWLMRSHCVRIAFAATLSRCPSVPLRNPVLSYGESSAYPPLFLVHQKPTCCLAFLVAACARY